MKKNNKRYKPPKGAGKKALSEHAAHRADFIRDKYDLGSPAVISRELLDVMLSDSDVARFPVQLSFSLNIEEGLFGICQKRTEDPTHGYNLVLHSGFQSMGDKLAFLAFYLLVRVNYGEFATFKEAEIFTACILGMPVDEYYQILCDLVDSTIQPNPSISTGCECSGGGEKTFCPHSES